MNRQLSADDRLVLERLLTRLAGRLDGAIDFWTLVCLGPLGPDPHGFLLHHGEAVKSLVVVIEDFLAGTAQSSAEAVRDLLGRLATNVQRLQDAFLVLERFRSLPLEEVRSATTVVADAYRELRDAIPQLGAAVNVPVPCWQAPPLDREAYYQGILQRLFDLFLQARTDRAAEVPTPS